MIYESDTKPLRTSVENLFLNEMREEDCIDIVMESSDIDDIMDIDSKEDLFDDYDGSMDDLLDEYDDEDDDDLLGL